MPAPPSSLQRLPRFGLEDYAALLKLALARGFQVKPVSALAQDHTQPTLFLRHDVDFYPQASLQTAHIEAGLGMQATYYFLLTGPYNLHESRHRRAVEEIAALGHECGLHYDLTEYPTDSTAATARLAFEADTLSSLTGRPVVTISTHNPHKGGEDYFRDGSPYVHPHDARFANGLVYVSDSRREWRDDSLLEVFASDPLPDRFMLLTHPESWSKPDITDNLQYLRDVVEPAGLGALRDYFRREVPRIWMKRSVESGIMDTVALTPGITRSRRQEIDASLADHPDHPRCEERHLDDDSFSRALVSEDRIVAAALTSRTDTQGLHIDAFSVLPEFRRQSVGDHLLLSLLADCRKHRVPSLEVEVPPSNTAALRLFLKHGFRAHLAAPDARRLVLRRECCPA